jgi:hypothetical protein
MVIVKLLTHSRKDVQDMSTPQNAKITVRWSVTSKTTQCKCARTNAEALIFLKGNVTVASAFAILKAQRRYCTYVSDPH